MPLPVNPTREQLTAAELDEGREVCPMCGKHFIVPMTLPAEKYGVCAVCYRKAVTAAMIEEIEITKARTEYNAVRQALYRKRRKAGISEKMQRTEPDFSSAWRDGIEEQIEEGEQEWT